MPLLNSVLGSSPSKPSQASHPLKSAIKPSPLPSDTISAIAKEKLEKATHDTQRLKPFLEKFQAHRKDEYNLENLCALYNEVIFTSKDKEENKIRFASSFEFTEIVGRDWYETENLSEEVWDFYSGSYLSTKVLEKIKKKIKKELNEEKKIELMKKRDMVLLKRNPKQYRVSMEEYLDVTSIKINQIERRLLLPDLAEEIYLHLTYAELRDRANKMVSLHRSLNVPYFSYQATYGQIDKK